MLAQKKFQKSLLQMTVCSPFQTTPLFSVLEHDHQQKILVFEKMLNSKSTIQVAVRLFLLLCLVRV